VEFLQETRGAAAVKDVSSLTQDVFGTELTLELSKLQSLNYSFYGHDHIGVAATRKFF
jgi:hypothetical protein